MNKLSHTNTEGKANMVDVGHKPNQLRTAKAEGFIRLNAETIHLIRENQMKKGDVLTIAEIAGIQGAKRTHPFVSPNSTHQSRCKSYTGEQWRSDQLPGEMHRTNRCGNGSPEWRKCWTAYHLRYV